MKIFNVLICVVYIVFGYFTAVTTQINFYPGTCMELHVLDNPHTWFTTYEGNDGSFLYICHGMDGVIYDPSKTWLPLEERISAADEAVPNYLASKGVDADKYNGLYFMSCFTHEAGDKAKEVHPIIDSDGMTYCIPTPFGVFYCDTCAWEVNEKIEDFVFWKVFELTDDGVFADQVSQACMIIF